jgi:hypothetical protein
MIVSVPFVSVILTPRTGSYIPATPQRPKPELRIVDPLLISVTAASASLNTLEPPRSIFGASDSRGAVVEYLLLRVVLGGGMRTL